MPPINEAGSLYRESMNFILHQYTEEKLKKMDTSQHPNRSEPPPMCRAAGSSYPEISTLLRDTAGSPIIDCNYLEEITSNSPVLLQRIITQYMVNTDELISDLRQAISTGDAPEVRRIAHKLSGSSSSCGMKAISPLFVQLEQLSIQGCLDGAGKVFDHACIELERIRNFIKNWFQTT